MNINYTAYLFNDKEPWSYCQHPFETYIPPNTKKVIIGTFPTYHKNYESTFDFFYGGKDNRFWKTIERVFNKRFKYNIGDKAIQERKRLLEENLIGITDMLYKCYRRGTHSQDDKLHPILLNDIFKLLSDNESVERLILTSRGKIYGALGLLETYFLQKDLLLDKAVEGDDRIMRTTFLFDCREIQVWVPHSTSPSNKNVTEDELFQMYANCLLD